MYTSALLVALLSPGSTPTVSQVPVSPVIYRTASGQVVYIVPSPSIRYVSPVVSSPTTAPAQTTTYVLSSSAGTTTTYASPVIVNGAPVVQYSTPVYTTSGQYQPAPTMTYSPVLMSSGAGTVCRT